MDVDEKIKELRKKADEGENILSKNFEELLRYEESCGWYSLISNAAPATFDQYNNWMRGYIKRGGRPSFIYKVKFASDMASFWIAKNSFHIKPLRLNIISLLVPKNVNVTGNRGVTTILPENGNPLGNNYPLFSDM